MRRRTIAGLTYTLTYDEESRLTQVSGGTSASFVYDGDGNRVKATFGSTTTVYVGGYYEQTGSTVRKYYYAGGERVAMRENGTLYWLLTDHLGSTAVTAYSSGGKKAELRYKAWGETRYSDGSTPTTYHFTGQREDVTIGLYFYGARYYDAVLGRFVQPDTAVPAPENPQALNRYSYVYNNPLAYNDPSGHIPCYGDPEAGECSWAGFDDRPFSTTGRRRDIATYAHFLEKSVNAERMTGLDAMIAVWEFASLFDMSGPVTADDVSYVLIGTSGPFTLPKGFHLKGKEFLTGESLNLPDYGDTGFHPNYRDWQNQPYHFWGYVNTTAQAGLPGLLIGGIANETHERWDPTEAIKAPQNRGASWEDYFLSIKGMEMGYLLHTGALSPDQAGDWMRRELESPAGPLYDAAKATGTWWWPVTRWQKMVDLFR